MLKYMVILAGVLVVLAATDEVQARSFRRSRGTCPNGQCYAPVPGVPAKDVAAVVEPGTTEVAEAAAVETPVTPAEVAPVADVAPVYTTNDTVTRPTLRFSFGARLFRRR